MRLDLLLDSPVRGAKTFEERRAAYHKVLRDLKPGLTMMIIHPAVMDPELKAMTNSAAERDGDYRIFMDPATQQLIRELGIKTVGWKDLR